MNCGSSHIGVVIVHADTAAHKFGRGLAGMTCGFLALPGNIVKKTEVKC